MNPRIKQLIIFFVIFVAGMSAGWVVGTVKSYQEAAGMVAGSNFNRAADNLTRHIALLQRLHRADYEGVIVDLEVLVDRDLVELAPYPPPLIPGDDQVVKAIRIARDYREKYPVSNSSPEVSAAIKKAFELAGVPDKQ